MQPRKDRTPKEKSRTRQNTSNRSSISSAAYHDIKAAVDRIMEQKNRHKESHRPRNLGSNTQVVKPCVHQPIMNNFIVVNHNYTPLMEKFSLKKEVIKELGKKNFTYKYIIGKGGFGKVWKVEHVKRKKQYAMKEMLKSIVLTKKSVQSILNEQKLLLNLNSPFLVNMHYAFQDRETLFLVLDLMEGGDLRHHIGTKTFTQVQAKFFIACILLGLEYLHKNNIIHRDIKPQNIVLDSKGYLRITDLGIARFLRSQNSSDTSGTPGYMSPEVICRQNHSFVSDHFALGVIAYELMLGKRPYTGYSRQEIRQNILSKQVQVRISQLPEGWSVQAIDFINKLIQRKPEQRLGFKGIQQIKNHPWVCDLNWQKMRRKQIISPFIPSMQKSDFDQDQKITIQDEEEAELIQKNSMLLRKKDFQDLFKDYYFNEDQTILKNIRSGQEPTHQPTKSFKTNEQKSHRSHTNPSVQVNNEETTKLTYFLKQLKF